MSIQRQIENVLNFPPKQKPYSSDSEQSSSSAGNVHPAVRRRRLLWCGFMITFVAWFLVELVVQQFRIWNREHRVEAQYQQVRLAQAEMMKLKHSIHRLKTEEYLMELAHKWGYRQPDEENYQVDNRNVNKQPAATASR